MTIQEVITEVSLNARYYDVLQLHFSSNPKEHTVTLGKFTSGGDWTHCQGSFTISTGYKGYGENPDRYRPMISFYSNPTTKGANGTTADSVGVEYMFDNFRIYSSKPAHFAD